MSDLKISLFQVDLFWEDPEKNREKLSRLIKGHSKTDVIILPETFTTGFSMNVKGYSEPKGQPTLDWMKDLAIKSGSCICGSMMVMSGRGVYRNRLYWVFPDGNHKHYDKRHLFTFAEEDRYYTRGLKNLIVEYKEWRIQPLICYDLRFPVYARNKSKNPYDLLIYVANWPSVRQTAWDNLLPARAIENASYVAGVNRAGSDEKGIRYSGGSVVYDFLGTPQNRLVKKENLIDVTISLEKLKDYRKKFPVLMDGDRFEIKD